MMPSITPLATNNHSSLCSAENYAYLHLLETFFNCEVCWWCLWMPFMYHNWSELKKSLKLPRS